jgi:hypothetical protein
MSENTSLCLAQIKYRYSLQTLTASPRLLHDVSCHICSALLLSTDEIVMDPDPRVWLERICEHFRETHPNMWQRLVEHSMGEWRHYRGELLSEERIVELWSRPALAHMDEEGSL